MELREGRGDDKHDDVNDGGNNDNNQWQAAQLHWVEIDLALQSLDINLFSGDWASETKNEPTSDE